MSSITIKYILFIIYIYPSLFWKGYIFKHDASIRNDPNMAKKLSPWETQLASEGAESIEIDAKGLTTREVNSRIKETVAKDQKVTVLNADGIHGIAVGLRRGEVIIKGNPGNYVSTLNSGAHITIEGDSGNFFGDNTCDGELIVKGNVGYGAGMYSYGGVFLIHGNATDAAAQMFKGGTLIIKGDVGDEVGLYMVGGDIMIIGNAGEKLGDWMIRGCIYLGGNAKSLGENARYAEMTRDDKNKLTSLLEKYGIDADLEKFKKVVPISDRPFYGK